MGRSGLLFEAASVPALAQVLAEVLEMSADEYAALSHNALRRFESQFSLTGYKANIRAFFFGELQACA